MALVSVGVAVVPVVSGAQDVPIQIAQLQGGTIAAIRIEGNQRIEEGTIRSYILVQPGDAFDAAALDRSLKALFATGVFADVTLRRDGSTLVVRVAENPIVNRIAFEGNHKLTEEQLKPELQLKPRAVFTAAIAQSDRQKILDMYAKRGRFASRVEPKIIKLDQNRVDVVFEINDGDTSLVSKIAFVGNKAFSESRLRDVITSRETAWWRFLSSSDLYDPERVNFDREQLRRYYLSKGYADFEVVSANAELTPDKQAFFITYAVNEGERYKLTKVSVNSSLRGVTPEMVAGEVELEAGDWYDGDAVERSTQGITTWVQNHGVAFVDVKARVARDRAKHTMELTFDVIEGPRVFVERIDIVGNERTMDKVVRREFRLAEGDPFNAALIRRSRTRLTDLDYFANVDIASNPGSAPDRALLQTNIQEKATGEFTIGGGYSSDAGALLSAGLRERNLIGTGINAGLTGVLAQKQTQVDFAVTDPYFLDRNIVAGFDIFRTSLNNSQVTQYQETRAGITFSLGYEFTEHLRQSWNYSLVQRNVYNVQPFASIYVQDEAGKTLLSQIGQTFTIDYRDSRLDPHTGFVVRVGTDFAGIGGDAHYVRTKVDGTYFYPLDALTGTTDWGIAISAGAGYLFNLGHNEHIIDRFFLGGDNLRGFQTGGAGPHAVNGGDSLGGRFIYTQSTELRFPLPVSPDLGLTGRAFVDIGGLTGVNTVKINGVLSPVADYNSPRVAAGVGVSWKTPFGLINIDLGQPLIKKHYDQTQIFRFGFGTRF